MSVLVIDVGTSGIRTVVVGATGEIVYQEHREALPSTPAPGRVEFDPQRQAATVLEMSRAAAAAAGPISAVGITNQRSSTVAWDRVSGEALGPGLGWQDLRTAPRCAELFADGIIVGPNVFPAKAAWMLDHLGRQRDLCIGTVDSWIAWVLSEGAVHVTDVTNASAGMLWVSAHDDWDPQLLEVLDIPRDVLPEVVDTHGIVGHASALPGAPPIAGIAGDQMASLLGQGPLTPGMAKVTFGTGGMLDLCVGPQEPPFVIGGPHGCAPMVACRAGGRTTWLVEGIMLAAGTNVEWLRDGLGIILSVDEVDQLAASCESSDGVIYVPALLGLGTPHWDFSARGTLLGLTRGVGRAQIARAVLEGIAQRAADLLEAAEADSGLTVPRLSVDGGMSRNRTFVQAVANAVGRPVDVAPIPECTSLGAALLAGTATGLWSGWDDVAAAWAPRERVEPDEAFDRDVWREACRRAQKLTD
jgi:glycerol kinase